MKARRYIIMGIMLCIGSIIYASEGTDELLKSVDSHLKSGAAKKALKLLDSSISKDKENYILLTKRAEIYYLMDRNEEALSEIQKVLEKHPQYCTAHLVAAQVSTKLRELDSALEHIDKAFAYNPDNSLQQSLFGLKGKIHLHQGDLATAEECLLIASSADDVPLQTMCDLAKTLSKNEKMDEAIVVLESSIERFGIQLNSMILAGTIQNKRGKYDDAIDYLDLALSVDGENPTALAALAEAYMYIDDLQTAEQKLKKALEHDETSAYAHKVFGDFLMRNDNAQGACSEYNLAVQHGYAEEHGQVEILFLLSESCQLE